MLNENKIKKQQLMQCVLLAFIIQLTSNEALSRDALSLRRNNLINLPVKEQGRKVYRKSGTSIEGSNKETNKQANKQVKSSNHCPV